MNDDLITLIYGDDAVMLFNSQMLVAYEVENGIKYGRIHKCDGRLVTDMKVKHLAPLTNQDDILGYLLITEEVHDKLYNSFYTPGSARFRSVKAISETPIYINAAILTESGSIVAGKCLISPCKVNYPSLVVTFKYKKYIGSFSQTDYTLECLNVVG